MKQKYVYSYEMKMIPMNIGAILLLLGVYIPVEILFNIDIVNVDWSNGFFIILAFLLWFVFHELLHGIGFHLSKGIDHKKIVYGISLEKGILYCMCKNKITKKDIIRSLLFPLVLIGIATLILGISIENKLLILLSIMNISGAIGDILMTFMALQMPKDMIYFDTDNATSFHIITEEKLENKKFFGFKLKSHSIYLEDDQTLIAHDFQKIKISKISKIILISICILYFITLIIK